MVHAANTVTYNKTNDDEGFNKEIESDSLEWNVIQTGVVLLSNRAVKVRGLHIG
jgi:hypothetical protein